MENKQQNTPKLEQGKPIPPPVHPGARRRIRRPKPGVSKEVKDTENISTNKVEQTPNMLSAASKSNGDDRNKPKPKRRPPKTGNSPPTRNMAQAPIPEVANSSQVEQPSEVAEAKTIHTQTPSVNNQNTPKPSKRKPKRDWMMKGVAQAITQLDASAMEPDDTEVSSASGFETLGTYNWVHFKTPTMFVPGGPSIWSPRTVPFQIPRDTGLYFRDQSSFRSRAHRFLPDFRAISLMSPRFRFDDVDIVTTRNSLRMLSDMVADRAKTFRIDLHVVNGTLIISPKVEHQRVWLDESQGACYGHGFEEKTTVQQPGLQRSSGHHRSIRYHLGSLNCVVTFEVDACIAAPKQPDTESKKAENGLSVDLQVLSATMKHLSLNTPTTAKPNGTNQQQNQLDVLIRGQFTPSACIAELKTTNKPASPAKFAQQLWFGRTPHLMVGTHTNGQFTHVNYTSDWAERFAAYETTHQTELRKLVRLLSELRAIVMAESMRTGSSGPYVAICRHHEKRQVLQVFASKEAKAALPDHIVQQMWTKDR